MISWPSLLAVLGCVAPPPAGPTPGEDFVAPVAGALVWIPGGTFAMGAPPSEPGAKAHDGPVHDVTVGGGWFLRAEVGQQLYEDVTGQRPSGFAPCADCPVEQVSWLDAIHFANLLSLRDGLEPAYVVAGSEVRWRRAAEGYRLPTEAEWEHAARGGQPYRFAGADDPTGVGWVRANAEEQPHPACGKPANGYGLCDMTGNVREWVWDYDGPYAPAPQTNPTGREDGFHRGSRGGGWYNEAWSARVAYRYSHVPTYRSVSLGFRVMRQAPAAGPPRRG